MHVAIHNTAAIKANVTIRIRNPQPKWKKSVLKVIPRSRNWQFLFSKTSIRIFEKH